MELGVSAVPDSDRIFYRLIFNVCINGTDFQPWGGRAGAHDMCGSCVNGNRFYIIFHGGKGNMIPFRQRVCNAVMDKRLISHPRNTL